MEWRLGVEEEFFVVRSADRRLAPLASQLVAAVEPRLRPYIKQELTPLQLELATPVCRSPQELAASLAELRGHAAAAAASIGCTLVASGTPPLEVAGPPPISPGERYAALYERFGSLVHEQGTCGTHAHVSVPSLDAAARACTFIRPWLPVLAGLTANSPFYAGADTGYASWRTVLLARWPTITPPPPLRSELDYLDALGRLRKQAVAFDPQTVYWWVRPAPHFSTVELRIADSQPELSTTLVYACLAAALVHAAKDHEPDLVATGLSNDDLRLEIWRAARFGRDAVLRSPLTGQERSFPELFGDLVGLLRPYLEEDPDTADVLALIAAVPSAVDGADRQRSVYAARGSLDAVVDDLVVAPGRPERP